MSVSVPHPPATLRCCTCTNATLLGIWQGWHSSNAPFFSPAMLYVCNSDTSCCVMQYGEHASSLLAAVQANRGRHVTWVYTDKVLSFQVQKMHDAQEVVPSEERSAKRRKTSPEMAAVKKKPAITRSMWCVPVLNLTPWPTCSNEPCHCLPLHANTALFFWPFCRCLLQPVTCFCRESWQRFGSDVSAAEKASMLAEKGFAFAFVEGALVKAVREGWWLLLDEINLAPAEVCPPSLLVAAVVAICHILL